MLDAKFIIMGAIMICSACAVTPNVRDTTRPEMRVQINGDLVATVQSGYANIDPEIDFTVNECLAPQLYSGSNLVRYHIVDGYPLEIVVTMVDSSGIDWMRVFHSPNSTITNLTPSIATQSVTTNSDGLGVGKMVEFNPGVDDERNISQVRYTYSPNIGNEHRMFSFAAEDVPQNRSRFSIQIGLREDFCWPPVPS